MKKKNIVNIVRVDDMAVNKRSLPVMVYSENLLKELMDEFYYDTHTNMTSTSWVF